VLDYRDLAASGDSPVTVEQREHDGMASEKERIRMLLLGLDARNGNDGGLSEEERKIWNLFAKDNDPQRFAAAADPSRIRAQRGLKERFREGLRISHRYLGEMEAIFRHRLRRRSRACRWSSRFDIDAYSKVGAAGIWQFMPTTATCPRRGPHERRDPLRATRGARHLKERRARHGRSPSPPTTMAVPG
jgi:membrane-bound lytic murein transglycosylase D